MNAYELADILHQSDFLAMDFAEDAATMLRQQADRIAELEGEVSNLKHINKNWQLSETMAYNRIAELEKLVEEIKYEKSSGVYDVSSKPVAWMQKDVLPLTYIIKAVVRREADEQYTIPLYTHPVKQLSDEELYKLAEQCGFNVDGKSINDGIETAADFHSELFMFARAIIKEITE